MKTFTTFLSAASAALMLTAMTAAAADSTRSSVDWEGRYTGLVPCASCPGIDMALTINEAGFYTLAETYREEKDGSFASDGTFTWDAAGERITLNGKDENRVFKIGEGAAWMVGADGQMDESHPLTKLVEYNGAGQQLYVDPSSIEEKDGLLSFSGLMNFEHPVEGGHRSLSADFVLNCATKQADMPSVSYFSDLDAGGEKLAEAPSNAGNWTPIPQGEDDVLAQMADARCP